MKIAIIGAGVIGCSIAREFSKYDVEIVIIEKQNDVSQGASKANSGIVHGGYDAKHGTMKGYFSRKGNRMYEKLNQELNFGYDECGSMVLAFNLDEVKSLQNLKRNGELNGVMDLRIIESEEILEMEPHVNPNVLKALYCPSAGVTSPYEMTIALAENAIANGAKLFLNTEVTDIKQTENAFNLQLAMNKEDNDSSLKADIVINCAGASSDKVSKMIGVDHFHIIPRRGEYILLHKNQGYLTNRVLFQAPTENGKGILVTRTYHNNLMLGPNAQEVQDEKAVGTSVENLKYIAETARKTIQDFDLKYTLRTFSGIRATSSYHDFIIEETEIENFINVAGIESPGLTSSPAIAKYVCDLVIKKYKNIKSNSNFNPIRERIIMKKDESFNGTIDNDDPKKNIICRCESVTEAEIVDSIHRGIRIDSLDAIKRRTRAGMGPCQGHFCGERVKKIIARETGLKEKDITLRGKGSSSLPKREQRDFWKKL